ncbi:MAG: ADP-ribosylation factor-like protein [Candidatus Hodarchaeales archaeon]|jgi:Ras-related GTP-binding protein A/B
MSDWVSDSEISARLGYKILIAGLSEAGKTAVKRIFFLKQQTKDVDSLSATINYERMAVIINDTPITIVDLGGQKIFLKRFLSGFSPFVFSNVKTFLFLIDVANKTSRNNSLQYFTGCLEKLKTFSPNAEIFVFLHKNDLVRQSPNYESIHEQLKEQFQLECSYGLRFFRTTIYKPETVIDSFGRIFELTVPELAKSDFVNYRTIGEIEERHKMDMTLREPTTGLVGDTQQATFTPKAAGDPAVLQKLQYLMKEAVSNKTTSTSQGPSNKSMYLGSAASEESTSETILATVEEPIPSLTARQAMETRLSEPVPEGLIPTPSDEIPSEVSVDQNPKIAHLMDFYRINSDQATGILNSGFIHQFEIAATSGIPVSLVLDVILKYLPFIKNQQGEEKFKTIDPDRLLELFHSYLRGELIEEDIVKCLVFATEKPNLSISKIMKKYLAPIKKEKKEEKEVKVEKPPEFSKIEIPLEADSVEGIVSIPHSSGIGFKVEILEPDGLNTRLTFHLQGSMGQRELIGSSIVSTSITPDELLYLLAYEMNLHSLGLFEDGIGSLYFSAKIIHQSINQIKEKNLQSSSEVKTKMIRKETGHLTETIEFIIPMEIKVNGNYIMIPDSENVAFSIEKGEKGFLINFVQRGFSIGQVNVVETVSVHQLGRLLKEAMQLPIESSGAIDFAGRVIHATINQFISSSEEELKEKTIFSPPKTVLPTSTEEQKDETSEKLKEYLALLDNE